MVVVLSLLCGLGDVAQTSEPFGPVVAEEVAQLGHLGSVCQVEPAGAVPTFGDETGLAEHAEVLRDRRAGDVVELVGDGGGRQFLGPDQSEDRSSPRFSQCFERSIHVNDVSDPLRKCQLNY
jgi:hypothetical protein